MRVIRLCTNGLARFFLSAVFLAGAINKILHWQESEKLLTNVLCDWQVYIGYFEEAQMCFSALTPWTPILLVLATLLELIGGLMVLLRIQEKLGAVLLILFLVPATVLMHQFWYIEGSMRELQTIMFLKNLAILGGLLLILLEETPSKSRGDDPFSSLRIG